MSTVRKWIPVDLYDIQGMEGWLEKLAAEQGLFLQKFGPFKAHFSPGAPRPVRYRMEPSDPKSLEKTDYYRECGWALIAPLNRHFDIYRSDDPQSEDLHTDPVAQSYTLDRLTTTLKRSALMLLLCLGAMVAIVWVFFFGGQGPVLKLVSNNNIIFPLLLAMECLSIGEFLASMRNVLRVRKQLREGIALAPNPRYHRTGQVQWVVMPLITIPFLFIAWSPLFLHWESELLAEDRPYPILSLAELEEAPDYQLTPFYYPGYEGLDRDNYVQYRWGPMASYYEVSQEGTIPSRTDPEGDEYNPSLDIDWYDLTIPALASPLLDDLVDYHTVRNYFPDEYTTQEYTLPGFDRFVIARDDRYGGHARVFAAAGDRVVYLNYFGEADLLQHADLVAEVLAWE